MALSSAEKTRRYRAHRRGDHALCDPARRCAAVEQVVRSEVDASGDFHGQRARTLLSELAASVAHDVMGEILLEEAARTLDRLDLLRGSGEVDAMTEARQQVGSLQRLLVDIRKIAGVAASAPPAARQPAARDPEPEKDVPRDDFASRLAARRAAASG